MLLVKFFVNVAVFNEKMFITKSCDQVTVANGFIGNTAVTSRGTLPTFSITEVSVLAYMCNTTIMINVCHVILILKARNI